jgi:hypothetical protein
MPAPALAVIPARIWFMSRNEYEARVFQAGIQEVPKGSERS